MQQSTPPTDTDERQLRAMQAEVQACLSLNRAMLRALAALSPLLNTAADAALEEEAERSQGCDRAVEIIDEMRERLHHAPAEAHLARALERALVDAADALPPESSHGADEEPARRSACR